MEFDLVLSVSRFRNRKYAELHCEATGQVYYGWSSVSHIDALADAFSNFCHTHACSAAVKYGV